MYTCINLTGLPPVPPELIEADLGPAYVTSVPGRTLSRAGQELSAGVYTGNEISDQLIQWLRDNIIDEWATAGYSTITPPCLGPHMDRTRFYTLQYVLDTGGDAVSTVFYRARSEDLEIDTGRGLYFNDYTKLEPYEVVRVQAGQWYLINGREIHSVENIQRPRTAIQIGLMRDPIERLILNFKGRINA